MEEKMISYLREERIELNKEIAKYGLSSEMVGRMYDAMIANKEMVEALIGKTVHIGRDGEVTVEL